MTAIIGCVLVLLAVLGLTALAAYSYGEDQGTKDERARADKRVRGVLSSDKVKNPGKKKKPSARLAVVVKTKPKKTIKVGEVEVPALVVKAKG